MSHCKGSYLKGSGQYSLSFQVWERGSWIITLISEVNVRGQVNGNVPMNWTRSPSYRKIKIIKVRITFRWEFTDRYRFKCPLCSYCELPRDGSVWAIIQDIYEYSYSFPLELWIISQDLFQHLVFIIFLFKSSCRLIPLKMSSSQMCSGCLVSHY